ncbi:MAG: LPS assembly lipoprotein LptE [Rhizobiaceae bacterium]
MSLFNLDNQYKGRIHRACLKCLVMTGVLMFSASCVYQPLYGTTEGDELAQIWVEDVDTRTAQQLRNHLIFLLQGGQDNPEAKYIARLRVVDSYREFAAIKNVRDDSAGSVTVSVSYDLIETENNTRVAAGNRVAIASYDRTQQSFANSRARRDAQNRAAKEAAEKLKLAFAADLLRSGYE